MIKPAHFRVTIRFAQAGKLSGPRVLQTHINIYPAIPEPHLWLLHDCLQKSGWWLNKRDHQSTNRQKACLSPSLWRWQQDIFQMRLLRA